MPTELQKLKARSRPETGKGVARKLRASGRTPATLYGEGRDAVTLDIDTLEFEHVIHGRGGEHAVMEIVVEDNPEVGGPALVKAVQHDPIKDHVLHADFLRFEIGKPIETVVPIEIVGQSPGVLEGGVIDQQIRELDVECLPLSIPEYIEVDISSLDVGDSLHVSDIKIPEGVTVLTDGDLGLIAVHPPQVIAEPTEEEEVAAGEVPEVGEEEGEEEGEGGGEGEES